MQKEDYIGTGIIVLIIISIFIHFWIVTDRMMNYDTTVAAHCN